MLVNRLLTMEIEGKVAGGHCGSTFFGSACQPRRAMGSTAALGLMGERRPMGNSYVVTQGTFLIGLRGNYLIADTQNRRYLQRGGGHYILGEKLRSGSAEATAALARRGRYQQVAENLRASRSVSVTVTGSWSVTTPAKPYATRRSATSCSPGRGARSPARTR